MTVRKAAVKKPVKARVVAKAHIAKVKFTKTGASSRVNLT